MKTEYDAIIIGAGAAGMMCAITAGQRGKKIWLIDHAKKLAEKIRISGGGRCNFTNIHTCPQTFTSQNPHFSKSALSQYTPQDFIALVQKHGIKFHEKKLGQLFCDGPSQQIIDMLLAECCNAGVKLDTQTTIENIKADDKGYILTTNHGDVSCQCVVIATGGLSIPKIGATKFGYDVAKKFGLNIIKTRAALVPLTFQSHLLEKCKALSGLSVEASVTCNKATFSEGLLFTHRGLSGPSILQISSYWQEGLEIEINLTPPIDILSFLKDQRRNQPRQQIQTALSYHLPKRLAQSICDDHSVSGSLANIADNKLSIVANSINSWRIKPSGTEGYRTAEVTSGGVDTNDLSSKTMEAKKQPGLFFIGEVVDVTGHLGGYNFQWAWSSGFVAGQHI